MIANIYNKVKRSTRITLFHASLLSLALCFTSCDDFLSIEPLNKVVLENFWVQKSDATSALAGCYASLASSESLQHIAMWGEIRSDNMAVGAGNNYDLEQIIKENILPTNNICDWKSIYTTINKCNILCHYAPQVQAIDPNYSETDMKANVAEAVAIRSLCYFYLIRTFRDVPFTRQASIDDTQNYVLPATPFEAVLDSIIMDLEAVKDDAVRRNTSLENITSFSQAPKNTSYITRSAIYAMLADMYLWKGDWEKVIECGQYVLDYKKQQYEEFLKINGSVRDMALFADKYPLIVETPDGETNGGNAYRQIFGNGNSFESIFELYYGRLYSGSNSNGYVSTYYMTTNNNIGRCSVPTEFYGSLPTENTQYFNKADLRAYEFIDTKTSQALHGIAKYARQNVTVLVNGNNVTLSTSSRSTSDAGWIVYRMTDVMLMMAEAYTELGKFEEAYELVNTVNSRACNKKDLTGPLVKEDYISGLETMRQLVLEERHRELMFEGKRWFDLVRMARREGNTKNLANLVVVKQKSNKTTVKIKLADPNIIYFPYSRAELRVNPLLHQNPAYSNGLDDDLSQN